MTVAYLLLSHRLPHQVLRLAATLRGGSPDAPVIVHHDDRQSKLDDVALRRLGGVELLRTTGDIHWGWTSQLDMLLRCLHWTTDRIAFDWLVVVSGQDYPARPLHAIERDLAMSAYDGYVEGAVVQPPRLGQRDVGEFARRYFYRYQRIPKPGPATRRAVAAARPVLTLRDMPWGVLLGRRCRTPFSAELPCRVGSDWLTLSRPAVETIVGPTRKQQRLLRHYRRTPHATESFPQTVLYAEPSLHLSGDTRRFASWSPGASSPATLRMADLDRIVASGTDFARKFDTTVDSAVLDELDRIVRSR